MVYTTRVWTPPGGGGLVWLAPGPWPHRLMVSEGLRHGGQRSFWSLELPLSLAITGDGSRPKLRFAPPRIWYAPGIEPTTSRWPIHYPTAGPTIPLGGGGGGLRGGVLGGVMRRGGGGWGGLWGVHAPKAKCWSITGSPFTPLPSNHIITLIKTEYWDRASGVVPMLLYVLGWSKVNWGLQLGGVGWRLRVACMWLCVMYSPPLFLHWQLAFASPQSHYCMNVTVCFVFPSLLLSSQMAFASSRSHYRTNVTVCFIFPSPFMWLQMAFGSPRSHYCMTVTVCFVFPSPF